MALASILTGLLSAAVFIVVFAGTALPALAVVEDDNAYVTWGVLVACVVVGWAAALGVNRLMRRLWKQ